MWATESWISTGTAGPDCRGGGRPIDGRRRRRMSRRESQDRGENREDDEAAQMRADDAIRGMGVTWVAGEEPSWPGQSWGRPPHNPSEDVLP